MKNIKVFTFNKLKGYTLLELLVVIGLITILMSFAVASYSTAQKKARDSKRRSDMKSIQSALEQYYSICNYKYPAFGNNGSIGAIAAAAGICKKNSNILPLTIDPLGGAYRCIGTCDDSNFTICPPANVNGGKLLETEDCSDLSCCVSNQQ